MLNTILPLYEGARPIDWLMLAIESLVCVLILYEVIITILERHRTKKSRRQVVALEVILKTGQAIQHAIPEPTHDATRDTVASGEIENWITSVDVWSKETQAFLEKISTRAAASFCLIINAESAGQIIHSNSGYSFPITGRQRQAYQRLTIQLGNLRSMMEKPEVYF
jgi:hypothetical protein